MGTTSIRRVAQHFVFAFMNATQLPACFTTSTEHTPVLLCPAQLGVLLYVLVLASYRSEEIQSSPLLFGKVVWIFCRFYWSVSGYPLLLNF
jgi:hypothetical protein